MRFCKFCGKENDDGAVFCKECGKSLQEEIPKEGSTEAIQKKPVTTVVPKKPMSKKNKILFSVIGGVVLLALITHLVLGNMYDPSKKIDLMNTAYNKKDKEAFFQQFNITEGTIANADNFYDTVNDYDWRSLREDLKYEVEKVKNKEHADIIYYDGNEFISVQKRPILFGLYTDIEFEIIPIELVLLAPYANMSVQFGGKEVVTEKEDEDIVVGKFIPGTYDWDYHYEDGYMPLSNKGTYTLNGVSNNIEYLTMDWDFYSIDIDGDITDAIVYINGKSTEQTIEELEYLYPVQLNSSIEVYAVAKDEDGNEVKSDVMKLDEDQIYLSFEHVRQAERMAEIESDLRSYYNQFRSDFDYAIYYRDFAYISAYFRSGSEIEKNYEKFIKDHEDIAGYYYNFIDNEVTQFKALSDTKFELLTFEIFDYTSDADGTLHYERNKKYVFTYEDEDIFIDEIVDIDTKKTKR